jgi:hypothetical protein
MNSVSRHENLLKQITCGLRCPVRFSVLSILAGEFIPRRAS